MPAYNYYAVNEKGRKVRGEITAANTIDLEERLLEIGLDLIRSKETKAKKSSLFSKVKFQDIILFCIQMEQLNRAGVPLLDAVADARDATESPKLKDVLTDVYEGLKGGDLMSESMKKHPRVFNSVFIGLVRTGEMTGSLTDAFAHLSHHMKWVDAIRRKVKKAMTYPIALLVVITIVMTVLMLFVVPKMTAFLLNQGFELPIHTRALIAFSDFFGNYWYVMLIALIGFAVSFTFLYRFSHKFAFKVDSVLLQIPVLGTTLRKIDMARFSHFFGIMFKCGIGVLECLEGAQKVVSNRLLKESVQTVHTAVAEGHSITESLRMSNQFPNLVVRMFKVGEESGDMNTAIDNINYFYDREVDDSIEKLIGMIKPVMTVILGGVILWVVAGVFGPLYESFSNMNF